MTRAALYVRVSTKEQTTENQELELRRWAEGLGFQVAHVYRETVTGARADRAALTAALAAAHQHQFDPPALLEAVPKVPLRIAAALRAPDPGFRGGRGECRKLKVSARGFRIGGCGGPL